MSNSRILSMALLAVIVIAGGFTAGLFIMRRANPPVVVPTVVTVPVKEPATTAAATFSGRHLVVTRAVYGDLPDGSATDVTVKVAAMVARDALTVEATNDNFGDPAEGIVKKLRVDYTLDGIPQTRSVAENEPLTIQGGPVRLVIKKAVYGDLPNGAATDVTEKVATKLENDALTIGATNDNFGDPAEGIVKQLRVEYTFDGKARTKTVGENEELTISNTGE